MRMLHERCRRPVAPFLLIIIALSHLVLGQDFELRLVDGSVDYGRLEVFYNGEWGTICDDEFTITNAEVACRQLGFVSSLVDYYSGAKFGEGTGEILLDDVSCDGTENFLASCQHNAFGVNDCSHSEDVGVSCGISNVDPPTSSSGSSFPSIGSWIGFIIAFVFIAGAASAYRRRRLYMQRQRNTTIIQPPSTTVVQVAQTTNNPGNVGVPTFYHGAQQPTHGGPPSYPAVTQPYPQGMQPYPVQQGTQPYPQGAQMYPPAGTADSAYPPQPPLAGNPPDSTSPNQAYPVQPYAYPPAPGPNDNAAGMAYPPQQVGQAPPMYPMGVNATAPPDNLPPPPSYDDIVKQ